jgi:hypothetical protein
VNLPAPQIFRGCQAHRAVVIPVILRACDWHSALFGKLNATPPDGKPVTKWVDEGTAYDPAFMARAWALSFAKIPSSASAPVGNTVLGAVK